jgi:geranylgeranyl pyrophosphate synthase
MIFKDYHHNGQLNADQLVRCYELYNQELLNVHLGQGLDIYWHQGHKNPSVQEYLQMYISLSNPSYIFRCAYKTGVLARLSARLGAYLSGASEPFIKAIGRFAEAIGVAFQIQDGLQYLF